MSFNRSLSFRLGLVAAVALIAGPRTASAQLIFQDDFDDNAAGWAEESLTGNFNFPGSDVVYGYDYSAVGIPEAPNSAPGDAGTRGVRLRTNTANQGTDQNAISLENVDFSNKYTVQVDMWLNWPPAPGALGTTIFGGLYVGDALPGDLDPTTPVQRGAGFIASSDGDCGNCDYILLKNALELDTFSGQYATTQFSVSGGGNQPGWDNTDINADPAFGDAVDLPAFFPEVDIDAATGGLQNAGALQSPGAVGFQWVTITAEVDPAAEGLGPAPGQDPTGVTGTTTFTLTNSAGQDLLIGTVDNTRPDILDDDGDGDLCDGDDPASEDICINLNNPLAGDSPVDMEGRVSLFTIDFFQGSASNIDLSFALFDNLMVFQTEDGGDPLPGDANNDGVVDVLDLDILGTNFGLTPATFAQGDFNEDGVVDVLDLDILGSNFGSMAAAVAAPEPTAALLATIFSITGIISGGRRRG